MPRTPRGAPDVAEQMPRAGSPTVLELRGGDDEDMDEYEGMQDMSPEADDDEAEDRCPVPDDSDSDSGESDVDLAVPQNRGAEVA